MPVSHAIVLLFFAVVGAFCTKVLLFGLRHGVIRPRSFYGPISYRDVSPGNFWYHASYWALYALVSLGFIVFYFYNAIHL